MSDKGKNGEQEEQKKAEAKAESEPEEKVETPWTREYSFLTKFNSYQPVVIGH